MKLFNEQKYAEAEAALASSTTADGQAYLGASLVKQGKHAAAEAPALAALEKQPTHSVAVAALGESLVKQAKYVVAIERHDGCDREERQAGLRLLLARPRLLEEQAARPHGRRSGGPFWAWLRMHQRPPTVKQLLATFQ